MKQRGTTGRAVRSLRRAAAGLLAGAGLCLAGLAAGETGFLTDLPLPAVPAAAAEQREETETGRLPLWQRLLFGETALLTQWAAGSVPETAEAGSEEPPEAQRTETAEDTGEDQPGEAATPGNIQARTITGTGPGYVTGGGVSLFNRTEKTVDLEGVLAAGTGLRLGKPEDGPQILIMHTHSTESFARTGTEGYTETGTARTLDTDYNIIRVGEEVTRIFTEMGLNVLHDTEIYDYPDYNEAYSRSKAGAEGYLAQYPTIQVILDIHRDALVGEDGTIYKPLLTVDGAPTAQVMLLVGSDDAGGDFPDWQEHLALAMEIQGRMNSLWPGLARPITLRTARFNQQLAKGSLLVEVGSHGNTLEETLAGARLFARAAGQVLQERQS